MEEIIRKPRVIIWILLIIAILVIALLVIGNSLLNERNNESAFKDLPTTHRAHDTVMWAIDLGITTGYADGTFQPEKAVTEAEFLAMLFRTFEDESEAQEDTVESGDWASRNYIKAIEKNWNVWGRASRNQVISRVDMAIIVTSALGFNLTEDGAIQAILDLEISQGKESATIDGFGFGELTRVEALETMNKLVEFGITELKRRPSEQSTQPELDSTFIQFVSPIEEVAEELGYSFQPVGWSRDAMIRLREHGIVYLTYRSNTSSYNQLVLYEAKEKRHRELVRDIFEEIGIPIDTDLDSIILQVTSERKSMNKIYGNWEMQVTPGNLEGHVQISFWKVE